jgi:23S rRNA pseudouridine1911/1915/1917 synthase
MVERPASQGYLHQITSWAVPDAEGKTRLDSFVRHRLPHLSLREVRRALLEEMFRVNGRTAKKGDTVSSGDIVAFTGHPDVLALYPIPQADIQVPIHYEDEAILILDKPAGIPTHGFSGRDKDTLANFLVAIRPSLSDVGNNRWEPGIVHRLDKDTSGLVLIAKNQSAFENLRLQFRKGLVRKRYWALVFGKTKSQGEMAYALVHDSADRRKMRVVMGKEGNESRKRKWRAVTRYQRVAHENGFSLLRVEIETGVTHQIRAHLQSVGHPVVGDALYGNDQFDPFGLGRQFLHAFYLGFRHPQTGKEMAIEVNLPEGLRQVLRRLSIEL